MLRHMPPPRRASAPSRLDIPSEPLGRELLAKFFRALGEPTRLALLRFCADQERTGSDCVAHTGLSQGRVSAHLACLVDCGLLAVRREGRFSYYRLADERVAALVSVASTIVADHAASIAACTRVAASGSSA
jgi:DNA-binding transcriptional ArsR family regulator